MNDPDFSVMQVQDVAELLRVTPEAIKKHVRELYPEIIKNGIPTFLTQRQITEIKKRMIPTTSVVAASTRLEMIQKTADVISWLSAESAALRIEIAEKDKALAIAGPKVESFEALQRSEKSMSITDAAKHFNLHVKTQVYPYFRALKYLNQDDTPSQAAIDAGYLAIRQARCHDGEFRPQACVLASQLETWRMRVVPQIEKWVRE